MPSSSGRTSPELKLNTENKRDVSSIRSLSDKTNRNLCAEVEHHMRQKQESLGGLSGNKQTEIAGFSSDTSHKSTSEEIKNLLVIQDAYNKFDLEPNKSSDKFFKDLKPEGWRSLILDSVNETLFEIDEKVKKLASSPHSAEGLTEKKHSSKVRKNAEGQKCHRK